MIKPLPAVRAAWPWLLASLAAGTALGWGLAISRTNGGSAARPTRATLSAPPPDRLQSAAHAREAVYQKASAMAQTIPLGEDLLESLHAVRRLENSEERRIAWRAFLDRMPKERWGEMYEALEEMYGDAEDSDPLTELVSAELGQLFAEYLSLVAPAEGVLVRDDAVSPPSELGTIVFQLWAERDPAAAASFLQSLNPENESDEAVDASELVPIMAQIMARSDPAGVLDWIARLPEDQRHDAYEGAFHVLAQADPAEAARHFDALGDLKTKEGIAKGIAERWARTDPEKALDWAQRLPPEHCGSAVWEAASVLARRDFDAVLERVADAPSQFHALGLLGGMAESVPAGKEPVLLALMGKLETDGGLLSSSGSLPIAYSQDPFGQSAYPWVAGWVDQLVRKWATQDAEAASAWLAGLPQGFMRENTVPAFASAIAASDPHAAAEWASTIGSDNERYSTLLRILKSWQRNEKAAAHAWIQQSPRLSQEDREVLLSPAVPNAEFRGRLRTDDAPDNPAGDNAIDNNAIDALLRRNGFNGN